MGSILLYIIIGAVIGIIARLLVPGTGGMGWLITVVVGILGALIGGYLAGAIWEDTTGVDWIASILVAVILVWIVSRMGRTRVT
ncbi:MAG TPA: GlsB/YeaQ/YmgE family stress response membrane protein [Acidimicrobiia bacterium]|nr:GlsB/YeaQ/YmgE family stress response membrane protein [Acidimicrobiia bacterium]